MKNLKQLFKTFNDNTALYTCHKGLTKSKLIANFTDMFRDIPFFENIFFKYFISKNFIRI